MNLELTSPKNLVQALGCGELLTPEEWDGLVGVQLSKDEAMSWTMDIRIRLAESSRRCLMVRLRRHKIDEWTRESSDGLRR